MTDDISNLADITFYDSHIPALKAGIYKTYAEQSVQKAVSDRPETEATFQSEDQYFAVEAPRFGLDSSHVHSVSPPANANGIFEDQLPHIVLNKPGLPWARDFNSTAGVPWMALLLFNEQDGDLSALQPKTIKYSDLAPVSDSKIFFPHADRRAL